MMGNLTRDPQLTYLPSPTPVVEFGLATNRKWRDKDGQDREEVCFIDCQAFGRTAENINKYCSKGRPLMIEGRLTLDRWEAQDGSKRSKHRIFIENFTFVDSKPSSGGAPAANNAPYNQAASADPAPANTGDDIPF